MYLGILDLRLAILSFILLLSLRAEEFMFFLDQYILKVSYGDSNPQGSYSDKSSATENLLRRHAMYHGKRRVYDLNVFSFNGCIPFGLLA